MTTLTETKKNNLFKIMVVIAAITLLFWYVGLHINVYQNKFLGAFFELIWLPTIVCSFGIPIAAFFFWIKDGFKITSKFLYLFVVQLIAIFLVLTF
ncbi:MAG: hypothetical protein V4648_08725 [Bacteroidota bacterium]